MLTIVKHNQAWIDITSFKKDFIINVNRYYSIVLTSVFQCFKCQSGLKSSPLCNTFQKGLLVDILKFGIKNLQFGNLQDVRWFQILFELKKNWEVVSLMVKLFSVSWTRFHKAFDDDLPW